LTTFESNHLIGQYNDKRKDGAYQTPGPLSRWKC